MNDPESSKPSRRPRYRGKNPRRFGEKYKEHRPDLYAGDVARVLAAGKTPAGMHRPILVGEILRVLDPKPGEVAVDCTLGYGGHARELLARVQPGGVLLGLDADPIELPRAEARLRAPGLPDHALIARRGNFAALARFVQADLPGGADVILADLGLSSMQIDDPSRGFSFKADGPLDMRMNPGRGRGAADLLASLDAGGLAAILERNADEPLAPVLAREILAAHRRSPLATTGALAAVVRATSLKQAGRDPQSAEDCVRRVFQAIRIAVNDEFGALEALLRDLPGCLKPGGRVAILTFHSGEDRRVKAAFKEGFHAGIYESIADEVIRASAEERRDNPRSSSAKLRYAVKAGQSRPLKA